jgi:hypothetical protein
MRQEAHQPRQKDTYRSAETVQTNGASSLFDIGEIILNASIVALVRTFRSFEIGDDEELVTALRAGLSQQSR